MEPPCNAPGLVDQPAGVAVFQDAFVVGGITDTGNGFAVDGHRGRATSDHGTATQGVADARDCAAIDGDVARTAVDGSAAAQGAIMVVSDQNDGRHRASL